MEHNIKTESKWTKYKHLQINTTIKRQTDRGTTIY